LWLFSTWQIQLHIKSAAGLQQWQQLGRWRQQQQQQQQQQQHMTLEVMEMPLLLC
jgi:hypothetical protein